MLKSTTKLKVSTSYFAAYFQKCGTMPHVNIFNDHINITRDSVVLFAKTATVVAIVALALSLTGCSSSTTSEVEAFDVVHCEQTFSASVDGDLATIEGPYGTAIVPQPYVATQGTDSWMLSGTDTDPVYVIHSRPQPIDEVVAAFTELSGEVFIETCTPVGMAYISTSWETANGAVVMALISQPGETIVVAAARPDGTSGGIRASLEKFIASWQDPQKTIQSENTE